MKIRQRVCLFFGVIILLLVIKAITQPDDVDNLIADAVYLESPVVLPENEGKNIIISGRVEMVNGCYDDELGITLHTPVAARGYEVEEQDSEGAYSWVSKGTKYFCGEAALGEFQLDSSMLLLLHKMDNYQDFDKNEIAPYMTENQYGRIYISIGLYQRVYYEHCDLEKNGEMTLVGIQKGNSIVVSDVSVAVNDGILSQRRLRQENKMSLIFGLIFGFAIAVGLIVYGLSSFIFKER